MAQDQPDFSFYYDKSADSGTHWLVIRGFNQPLAETRVEKLLREINKSEELSALRFGPSWRAAGNGRAYDFWMLVVDKAGNENPSEASIKRVLKELGGKADRDRGNTAVIAAPREDSPEAQSRMADMAEQVRAMRRTLERAVNDAKAYRASARELEKEVKALREQTDADGKRIQSLEADLGWIQSKKSAKTKEAKKALVAKEHTLKGIEAELVELREERNQHQSLLEHLQKSKLSPIEAFRFALDHKFSSTRLHFAQAATVLFHRLANDLRIETHEQGWMKQVRNRLVGDKLLTPKSPINTAIGEVHAFRTQVIHQNATPTKQQLKDLARKLSQFEEFVERVERQEAEAMLDERFAEEIEPPSYGKSKRSRKGSLRDHRKRKKGRSRF